MYYISFNGKELGILLSKASAEETQLYLALRKFADFKTGGMTHPAAGRLNYSFLARMLSREARQGVEACNVHRMEISRRLDRLVLLGLVENLGRKGKALTMRLPLVGMELQTEREQQTTHKKTCEPEGNNGIGLCGRSAVRKTVGTISKSTSPNVSEIRSKQSLFAGSASDSGMLCAADCNESTETQSGQGKERFVARSSSTQSKSSVHPHSVHEGGMSPSSPKTITPPAAAGCEKAEKPEARFRDIVEIEGNGIVLYIDSDTSQRIYKSWVAIGASEKHIREAVRLVVSDASKKPIPNSIDTVLRSLIAPKKSAGRNTGKGSIVL